MLYEVITDGSSRPHERAADGAAAAIPTNAHRNRVRTQFDRCTADSGGSLEPHDRRDAEQDARYLEPIVTDSERNNFV